MPKKVSSLRPDIKGQEELSPFATRLIDSRQTPLLGQNQVAFWGDTYSGRCGIFMRIGNRTFQFYGTEVDSGGDGGTTTNPTAPPFVEPATLSGYVSTEPDTLSRNTINAIGAKGLVIDSDGSENLQEWQINSSMMGYFDSTGRLYLLGGLDAGGSPVTNIPWPVNPADAVNLDYLQSEFVEVVSALPTPSEDYDRKQVCLRRSGYPDIVYRCLQNSDTTWEWCVSEGASY